MASEEIKKFRQMMELIQDSCRSFNEFKEEARKIVRRTRSFAVDTIEYTGDAQDDDLELKDTEGLLEEWRDTNKKMEQCIEKADTVKGLFNKSFEKLSEAQGIAVDGQLCAMEHRFTSLQTSEMCNSGAGAMASLGAATAATGGLALPLTFIAGGFLLTGGALVSALDSDKHVAWEEKFAIVDWKLGKIYSLVKIQTDFMRKKLNDMYHESSEILDKTSSIASRSKLSRSGYFKLKCRRLEVKLEGLKSNCDQYIQVDDEVLGIDGSMARLSIEN